MIEVRRADQRYRSEMPGITSFHCFSAGGHYDPANLRFGTVIALDEHVVSPGAGFAEHAHRGVELLSWVLEGELRHRDVGGRTETVPCGLMQYQRAGTGIRHSEVNASAHRPLRFVQIWLDDADGVRQPDYLLGPPPVRAGAATAGVLHPLEPTGLGGAGWVLLYVTRGPVRIEDATLQHGDSVRLVDTTVTASGSGELLAVSNTPLDGI